MDTPDQFPRHCANCGTALPLDRGLYLGYLDREPDPAPVVGVGFRFCAVACLASWSLAALVRSRDELRAEVVALTKPKPVATTNGTAH